MLASASEDTTVRLWESRGNSFQRMFKNNLADRKTFSLFYGGLKKKYLKKYILQFINAKPLANAHIDFRHRTLKFFESRLDTVLHRANFSSSIRSASQLILHGHVLVNGNPVRTKSYILKVNDSIEIAFSTKSRSLVEKSLDRSNFWPIPPKHLLVNYKTLQIIFVPVDSLSTMPIFNHYLNIDSVITNIKKY